MTHHGFPLVLGHLVLAEKKPAADPNPRHRLFIEVRIRAGRAHQKLPWGNPYERHSIEHHGFPCSDLGRSGLGCRVGGGLIPRLFGFGPVQQIQGFLVSIGLPSPQLQIADQGFNRTLGIAQRKPDFRITEMILGLGFQSVLLLEGERLLQGLTSPMGILFPQEPLGLAHVFVGQDLWRELEAPAGPAPDRGASRAG